MKIQIIITIFLWISIATNSIAIEKKKVSFKNGDITLKGKLYLPKGKGPFPAVVFVHGSGPEKGSNSSYSAKWMAAMGYAALVYDKRGVGKSDGEDKEWNRFNFIDLADDVIAAVNFLAEQNVVDKTRIGIHAASQGGWVVSLAASKTDLISFMIIKSASVCSIGEDRIFERSARLGREGFSISDINEAKEMQMVEAKTTPGMDTPDEFTKLFEQNKDKIWFPRVYLEQDPFSKSLVVYRIWYSTIVDFNSITYLEQFDIPILWIFGDPDLDQSGPVEKSIVNLKLLKQNGKSYEILSYKGQGHNVEEGKYELDLFNWLKRINDYHASEFKKHTDTN